MLRRFAAVYRAVVVDIAEYGIITRDVHLAEVYQSSVVRVLKIQPEPVIDAGAAPVQDHGGFSTHPKPALHASKVNQLATVQAEVDLPRTLFGVEPRSLRNKDRYTGRDFAGKLNVALNAYRFDGSAAAGS